MIGFVGLSHLGILSSLAAASKTSEHVVAFDPDAARCRDLSQGRFPIYEKGLEELFRDHASRLRFTSDPDDLKSCAVIHLSIDIATDEQNRGDLTQFNQLFDTAIQSASANAVLVVMSQLQPGTMRRLLESLRGKNARRDIKLYYQVETLIFGSAVERALKPERFILGCEIPSEPLPGAYKQILSAFGCPVFPMRYESAELAKISINICLAASLCVANTLAELCETVGADWSEIVPALKSDRRIGPYSYLVPGLGIGGGNIERDLAAVCDMARARGTDGRTIEAFLANSAHRKNWPIKILKTHLLANNPRPRIGIWGIAYKSDTASTRNSPSVALMQALSPLPLKAYDPQAVLEKNAAPNCIQVSTAHEAGEGVDALVIMTPWNEFSNAVPSAVRAAMSGTLVVDPYRVLDREKCRAAGIHQFVLGAKEVSHEV